MNTQAEQVLEDNFRKVFFTIKYSMRNKLLMKNTNSGEKIQFIWNIHSIPISLSYG